MVELRLVDGTTRPFLRLGEIDRRISTLSLRLDWFYAERLGVPLGLISGLLRRDDIELVAEQSRATASQSIDHSYQKQTCTLLLAYVTLCSFDKFVSCLAARHVGFFPCRSLFLSYKYMLSTIKPLSI